MYTNSLHIPQLRRGQGDTPRRAVKFSPSTFDNRHAVWHAVCRAPTARTRTSDENPLYMCIFFIIIIRAKRVSNWYIPKKKSARVPVCPRAACTCAIILVLVCGFMYHIRTYLVSARYQPAAKIRICIYVCARVGYVLCATYVRKLVWARLFVPGISRQ